MYSSEASCSDCKLEKVEQRWTLLLLKWLNRCVAATPVRKLNYKSLAEVMTKYKKDICVNEMDRTVLCTDNVESFIKYKYPILRLRNLCEGSDIPRRLYVATTIVLYHCCMNAREGAVDEDICRELTEYEQEKILKFCENLSDMEVTVNNVEKAITDAFECKDSLPGVYHNPADSSDTMAYASDCAMKESSTSQADHLKQTLLKVSNISAKHSFISEQKTKTKVDRYVCQYKLTRSAFSYSAIMAHETVRDIGKLKNLIMFNSSVTVLPSVVAETDTYSDLETDSDVKMMEKDNVESAEISNVYFPKPTEIGFVKAPVTQSKCEDGAKRFAISRHKVYGEPSKSIYKENETRGTEREKDRELDNDNYKYYKKDESDEFRYEKHRVTNVMTEKRHEDRRYDEMKGPNERIMTARMIPMKDKICLEGCSCSKCTSSGPCCGDPSSTLVFCDEKTNFSQLVMGWMQKHFLRSNANGEYQLTWNAYLLGIAVLFSIIILVGVGIAMPMQNSAADPSLAARIVEKREMPRYKYTEKSGDENEGHSWECVNSLCQKVYDSRPSSFSSFARCSLICMGPQIWPLPIGYTKYSNKIVALSTSRLEYKFQSLPCDAVHQYVAEAFKTFLGHLVRLEKQSKSGDKTVVDLPLMKLYIQIFVETDTEPRIRLNTDESYNLAIESVQNQLVVKVSATSFCGVRHGLETLSQLILLDQTTGKLITLSDALVKDAPSHKYRGLMIDTARNYIPMQDLIRTIDAMATVKLNTFHWRISDVTSFPLLLPELAELFEFGAYDRSMVYTKDDITSLANRAHYRGIRIVIEVAAPGPVGRPWSWSPDVSCHKSKENFTCNNILCLRLNMKDSVFDTLERIYANIIEMTRVDDIFHLSDGIFSLTNCLYLVDDREGFLEKALFRLKQANKGFLPELPIVWYTSHLNKDFEARAWEKLGVQYNDLEQCTSQNYLTKFKVIYSAKWDLSCLMEKQRCKRYRTWQEMYSWTSWRNIEVFTIQGGEAILWTDLVTSSNLDSHIWPRAAAVAERLWSDIAINTTVSSEVYVRLDHHRWRMVFHGINVQPVWPVWCSFNPGPCLEKKDYAVQSAKKK